MYIETLKPEFINKFWPTASKALRDGMVASSAAAFKRYNKITPDGLAKIFGQASLESGRGVTLFENLNYSATRLVEIFGVGKHSAKITPSEAKSLARNQQKIANRVYGRGNPKKAQELGNIYENDGWNFRGQGILQLTGRKTYREVGALCGLDLENNPGWATDPRYALLVMLAFFEWKKRNKKSVISQINTMSVSTLTQVVNGGQTHLAERIDFTNKAAVLISAVYLPRKLGLISTPILDESEATVAEAADQVPTQMIVVEKLEKEGKAPIVTTPVVAGPNDPVLASFGDTDNDFVRTAQRRLPKGDYYAGKIDGDYGTVFRDALFSFQANNGFVPQINLTQSMLDKMEDIVPRPLSAERTAAKIEDTPELAKSPLVRFSNKIKAGAYALLGMIGIDATNWAPSSLKEAFSMYTDNEGMIGTVFGYVRYIISTIVGNPFFLLAVVGILLYVIYRMRKDKVAQFRAGMDVNITK